MVYSAWPVQFAFLRTQDHTPRVVLPTVVLSRVVLSRVVLPTVVLPTVVLSRVVMTTVVWALPRQSSIRKRLHWLASLIKAFPPLRSPHLR